MKIEVGKEYKVLLSKLGFKKGEIIGVVSLDCDHSYRVVVNRFQDRRLNKSDLESMLLEAYEDAFSENYDKKRKLNIENGKRYRSKRSSDFHNELSEGTIVEVIGFEGGGIEFVIADQDSASYNVEVCTFEAEFEGLEEADTSKPAHYDTEIDTLAFAKANFSREQVEGFMRINAIKYLQRDKGQKLSDLKKARHYIDMLIEMEESE